MKHTPRENLQKLLSGESPDWIPFTLDIGSIPGFASSILKRFQAETGATDPAEYFDFDFRTASVSARFGGNDPAAYHDDVPEGTTFDEWGVGHWAGGAVDTCDQMFSPLARASTPDEVRDYPEPTIDTHGLAQRVESFHGRGYPAIGYAGSMYEWSWWLRGMEPFMMDLLAAPELALALLDKVESYTTKLALTSAEAGIDVLAFYDDTGTQTATQISPGLWREIIKPAWKRVLSEIKACFPETAFFLHSCGNIAAIVPDIVEIGFDILHPIQPECMDVAEVKREFGHRIVPCATLGCQHTLSFGTSDEVRREVERLKREVSGDRRIILCPSNSIQPETPWENILAFVEAARG